MIVVDGNDGLGKSTLVTCLRQLGYQVADRGMPTKATDDGVPEHLPMGERYVILDAPVEVSRARLAKAGRDMNEKYHTVEGLTHYRKRFEEVAAQLHVPLIDASGTPDDVLAATFAHLGIQPRRWGIWVEAPAADKHLWSAADQDFWWRRDDEIQTSPTRTGVSDLFAGSLAAKSGDGRLFTPRIYSTLRIGLPKGRLQEPTWEKLVTALHAGRMPSTWEKLAPALDASRKPFPDRAYRKLYGNVEVVLLKPRSIPQMLSLGMIDAGFCGLDLVEESGYGTGQTVFGGVEPIVDLGTNRVQLVVAAADPDILKNPPRRPLTIATEFPNIADRWASGKGLAHICVNSWGSTEAWVPTFCDLCIDVVETGETMRANGLTILDEILSSSTRLCVRQGSVAPHHEVLLALNPIYMRSGPLVDVTGGKKAG